jgi:hypothetical protein
MTAANWASEDELPAIFHRSRETTDRWIKDGALPSVKIPNSRSSRYVRRSDIDAILAPARRLGAEVQAIEADGGEPFSAAQLDLVRRVMGDGLASLPGDSAGGAAA